MRLIKNSEVIAGKHNLLQLDRLKSRGNVKRMLSDYLQQSFEDIKCGSYGGAAGNEVKHDKREFVAFTDERDHLGRLIKPVSSYIKQLSISFIGISKLSTVFEALCKEDINIQTP